jgi:hypothetical protein
MKMKKNEKAGGIFSTFIPYRSLFMNEIEKLAWINIEIRHYLSKLDKIRDINHKNEIIPLYEYRLKTLENEKHNILNSCWINVNFERQIIIKIRKGKLNAANFQVINE